MTDSMRASRMYTTTMMCDIMSHTMTQVSQKGCYNEEHQSSQKAGDE
jgi:hypothetical protein